jgi:hypothetical protein
MKFNYSDDQFIFDNFSIQSSLGTLVTQFGSLNSKSTNIGCNSEALFANAMNSIKIKCVLFEINNAVIGRSHKEIFSLDKSIVITNPLISWDLKNSSTNDFINIELNSGDLSCIQGKTLYLASVWGASYFHFISETLGKCLIANNFLPLLEFDNILISGIDLPYVKEWFKYLGVEDKLVDIGTINNYKKVDSLIIPSYSQHCGWFSRDLINFIKSSMNFNNYRSFEYRYRKIYIIRSGSRRILNESLLIDFLKKYGFEFLYLENLSQYQQAEIFAQSSHIIAPHGAGLTNLIYCSPGVKVFEFFGSEYKNLCFFGLCDLLDLEHFYHVSDDLDGLGNYSVDLSKIEHFISNFFV